MTPADVTRTLRLLGAGPHSTRDVWWALCLEDLNVPVLPSVGGVEGALLAAWEAGAVNQERGGWVLASERGVQMSLNNDGGTP